MYYTVTISYRDRSQTDTFSIDKNELIKFIEFITKNIENLETFYVHYYPITVNNIYAH